MSIGLSLLSLPVFVCVCAYICLVCLCMHVRIRLPVCTRACLHVRTVHLNARSRSAQSAFSYLFLYQNVSRFQENAGRHIGRNWYCLTHVPHGAVACVQHRDSRPENNGV